MKGCKKKIIPILLVILIVGSVMGYKNNKKKQHKNRPVPIEAIDDNATLTVIDEIIDGATLKINSLEKGTRIWKMTGIDVPAAVEGEKLKAQVAHCGFRTQILELGLKSKAYLQNILESKVVTVLEEEGEIKIFENPFLSVNYLMAQWGYAWADTNDVGTYVEVTKYAKDNRRGLWKINSMERLLMLCLEKSSNKNSGDMVKLMEVKEKELYPKFDEKIMFDNRRNLYNLDYLFNEKLMFDNRRGVHRIDCPFNERNINNRRDLYRSNYSFNERRINNRKDLYRSNYPFNTRRINR